MELSSSLDTYHSSNICITLLGYFNGSPSRMYFLHALMTDEMLLVAYLY